MAEKLEDAIDWIYDHITDEDDREHLVWWTEAVDAGTQGGVVFEKYTGVVFSLGGEELFTWVKQLVTSRDLWPEVLVDLKRYLGVHVNVVPATLPPAVKSLNPVGTEWPEKGSDIYHTNPTEALPPEFAVEGRIWSETRGTFVLEKKGWLWVTYYQWRKIA